MDKIKPYSFWIIAGAVLILELIIFLVILTPSNEIKPRWDVHKAAREADKKFKTLQGLQKKAKAVLANTGEKVPSNPAEAVSPEDRSQVEAFLDKYLIHDSWEEKFAAVVKNYNKQVADIQDDLRNRSKPLHEPVSSQTVGLSWYRDYLAKSRELLLKMYEQDRVILPASAFKQDGESAVLSTENIDNADVREVMGYWTSSQSATEDDIRRITPQFNITRQLCDIISSINAPGLPNPLVPEDEKMQKSLQPESSERFPVVIRGITFSSGASDGTDILPGADEAKLFNFSVRLRGSPSALLKVVAEIDNITQPVIVRLGGTWKRLTSFDQAENSSLQGRAEVIELNMDLVYIDFSDIGDDLATEGE